VKKLKLWLNCKLGRHEHRPYTAVVQGPGLQYSAPTPAMITIRTVCVRDGCSARKDLRFACPATLAKLRKERNP
jgi:hypothetical protein